MTGTILVIDDDDDNRDALGEVLRDEGYEVTCARDGAEALALLRGMRPDVILLDLNMPTMDGMEFRAAQRRDPSLALIPTVVMTASDRLSRAMGELAPEATVRKPLKLGSLLSVLRRYAPPG